MRPSHWVGSLGLLLTSVVPGYAQSGPEFALGFAGCPERAVGEPGSPYEATRECTLSTSSNPTGEGVQGWTLSLAAVGTFAITDATVTGTAGEAALGGAGLVEIEMASEGRSGTECEGLPGVFVGVVLSITQPVTLPAEGTETILRLDVRGTFPSTGESEAAILYADGCRDHPIHHNKVTHLGLTYRPSRSSCITALAAPGAMVPGDSNEDGTVDISDAVCLLLYLYSGAVTQLPCGDGTHDNPANKDLLDWDGNASIDVTDAIAILTWYILGGTDHALGITCRPIAGCPITCM